MQFDFGRYRRQWPAAEVRVDRGGQEVRQRPDRRGRRRDEAEEARVPVEERVIEEKLRGLVEQAFRRGPRLREPAPPKHRPHHRRILARRHLARGHAIEELREAVDEAMAESAEVVSGHFERNRRSILPVAPACRHSHSSRAWMRNLSFSEESPGEAGAGSRWQQIQAPAVQSP